MRRRVRVAPEDIPPDDLVTFTAGVWAAFVTPPCEPPYLWCPCRSHSEFAVWRAARARWEAAHGWPYGDKIDMLRDEAAQRKALPGRTP